MIYFNEIYIFRYKSKLKMPPVEAEAPIPAEDKYRYILTAMNECRLSYIFLTLFLNFFLESNHIVWRERINLWNNWNWRFRQISCMCINTLYTYSKYMTQNHQPQPSQASSTSPLPPTSSPTAPPEDPSPKNLQAVQEYISVSTQKSHPPNQ